MTEEQIAGMRGMSRHVNRLLDEREALLEALRAVMVGTPASEMPALTIARDALAFIEESPDEERSAPQAPEARPTCSAVFDEFLCGRAAGHAGKHCDFHTADSPTMWDPISAAAQGEEK